MTRRRLARIYWISAAASVVAAALVALLAVLRDDDFSDTGRILGTLAAALVAGSTLVAGLALVERGMRLVGWPAVAAARPAFGGLVYAIWALDGDGDPDAWRWGWSGALILVAALIALTARLLAQTAPLVRLASAAGILAVSAAAVSTLAIWSDAPGDTLRRAIGVLWILTGLCYLLVPVLHRVTTAGDTPDEARVLDALAGVELIVTRSRAATIDPGLEPGERLALRHRN